MIAALIGIALVIVAVVLWLGSMTVAHAVAILIGARQHTLFLVYFVFCMRPRTSLR